MPTENNIQSKQIIIPELANNSERIIICTDCANIPNGRITRAFEIGMKALLDNKIEVGLYYTSKSNMKRCIECKRKVKSYYSNK